MCIKALDRCLLDCSHMDDFFLLTVAARLAEEAGAEILALRARGYQTTEKADRSPVTDADIASQGIIVAGLRSATPDVPVIAEESPSATGIPSPIFWLVDPLDGTREFAAGLDEFVVNIAFVRDHKVVLGAVAAPARKLLFTGIVGQGAWKYTRGEGIPIRVRNAPRNGLVALVSRHDADDERLAPMLANTTSPKPSKWDPG
jgi:3'(2'), 5'-bisphosphate nucleotidase